MSRDAPKVQGKVDVKKPPRRAPWKVTGKGRIGRKPPGEMNKLEAAYAAHLEGQKMLGQLEWYEFERFTFTISHGRKGVKGQRYTPDFAVMLCDGTLEMHEIKGFRDEKNINKLKIVGEMFPLVFRLVTRRTKKDGGGWKVEEF